MIISLVSDTFKYKNTHTSSHFFQLVIDLTDREEAATLLLGCCVI